MSAWTVTPSAISAVADRGEARLGEPFRVSVEVRHAPELRYELSASQAPGPFAILGGGCTTRRGAGDAETRCEVDLALLDLGVHAAVLRLDASGAPGAAPLEVRASAVQAIGVTDAAVAASAIPLHGMPAPVPLFVPTWAPLGWIALGSAVALAIAVAVVRRVRDRVRAAEERRRAEPRVRSPSEIFDEALAALAAVTPAKDVPASAFFALSRALREYLAALSPRATLDLTAAELLVALRRAPIGGLEPGRLAALATELDRLKFAGAAPAADAWPRALHTARAILESTRPPRWHPDREARRA